MKKLKIKVLTIIFSILSLVIISVCLGTNLRNYYTQKQEIQNILNRSIVDEETIKNHRFDIPDNSKGPKEPQKIENEFNDKRRIFLNYTVYTVILDNNGKYLDIINHTENEIDENNVKSIAEKIIDNHSSDRNIGNLYFEKYSYAFTKNGTLMIVDNSKLNKKLCISLIITIIVMLVLEIIVWFITLKLTRWVIKPVEESFERQKRFIADASHELKTPLTVMIASSDAFYKDGNKKWIDNMKSEAERMTSLVTDLLDLSQIENEKNLNFQVDDLSNIIESSILTFESLFYESNLKLEYEISEDIKLKCNKNQIKQLITILMDNAIKHSKDTGKVIINLRKDKKDIILEVKNKGVSIKKADEEKIFERFYKTDTSRNRNSNNYGLGLAIAKSIVENHNGVISVSSKDGYTIFKIKWGLSKVK